MTLNVALRESFWIQLQNPMFKATMGLKRFEDILSFIMFDDKSSYCGWGVVALSFYPTSFHHLFNTLLELGCAFYVAWQGPYLAPWWTATWSHHPCNGAVGVEVSVGIEGSNIQHIVPDTSVFSTYMSSSSANQWRLLKKFSGGAIFLIMIKATQSISTLSRTIVYVVSWDFPSSYIS